MDNENLRSHTKFVDVLAKSEKLNLQWTGILPEWKQDNGQGRSLIGYQLLWKKAVEDLKTDEKMISRTSQISLR